jgi:hypothetical protein
MGRSAGPSANPINSFGPLSSTGAITGNSALGQRHSQVPHKLARWYQNRDSSLRSLRSETADSGEQPTDWGARLAALLERRGEDADGRPVGEEKLAAVSAAGESNLTVPYAPGPVFGMDAIKAWDRQRQRKSAGILEGGPSTRRVPGLRPAAPAAPSHASPNSPQRSMPRLRLATGGTPRQPVAPGGGLLAPANSPVGITGTNSHYRGRRSVGTYAPPLDPSLAGKTHATPSCGF